MPKKKTPPLSPADREAALDAVRMVLEDMAEDIDDAENLIDLWAGNLIETGLHAAASRLRGKVAPVSPLAVEAARFALREAREMLPQPEEEGLPVISAYGRPRFLAGLTLAETALAEARRH